MTDLEPEATPESTTSPADESDSTVEVPARRRRIERPPGAALVIIAIGVILAILALVLAVVPGTIRDHNTVDKLTTVQVAYVKQQLAAGRAYAAVENAVVGTQFGTGFALTTTLEQTTGKQYLLTVTGADGYAREYNSTTHKYSSTCDNFNCWFGIVNSK